MKNLHIQVLGDKQYREYYERREGKTVILPAGFYDHKNGRVVLKNVDLEKFIVLETVVHEIIHGLSDNGLYKLGFIQYDKVLGSGFNEMATCYITTKVLGRGYGGGYSEDYRAVFSIFLTTMKMADNELFKLFFQDEDWITEDIISRFNKKDSQALCNLIRLYDVRSTNQFDVKKVLHIVEQSANLNQVQESEKYREKLNSYCDYFEILMPDIREQFRMKLRVEKLQRNSKVGEDECKENSEVEVEKIYDE